MNQKTPTTPPQQPPAPSPHKHNPAEETVKETLESIVIAFVLAFVFRAYVVEAFVIPTGSMAPTLAGRHLSLTCSQCGYRFRVDTPNKHESAPALKHEEPAICAMCHFPNPLHKGNVIDSGDRILVQKFIYSLTEPKRWDIVVFKAPHDPDTNFIKRLIGLPNEQMWIIDGNIYVRPLEEPDDAWIIARKTDRPHVQRSIWQPIYHNIYVPLDGGRDTPGRTRHSWGIPWSPNDKQFWDLNDRGRYRFDPHLATANPNNPQLATLRFNFERHLYGGPGLYTYNQFKDRRGVTHHEPIEDIRIAATFVPDAPGLAVAFTTTTRWDSHDGTNRTLMGRIEADGTARLLISDKPGSTARELLPSVKISPFQPGQPRHVELWYADQELSLWVDEERVLAAGFQLPIDLLMQRPPPHPHPDVSIEVSGPATNLHRVELDRDLYYASQNPHRTPARGGLLKGRGSYSGQVLTLRPDQFFCVGDNSPLSHDSRYWDKINPWVERRSFDDATPPEDRFGVVPRRLMMGKAFFVYWPAPLHLKPDARGLIVNFGDMRFIH